MAFVTVAWMFGAVWHTVTTGAPLTLFARGLGASHFQFGLLAAMPYIAALAALPGSLLVERTGDRKRLFLFCHYLQRSLWVVIAVAPVLLVSQFGPAASPRAVTIALALIFLMYTSGAFGGPAWVSWMADVVPPRVRGAYFARRRMWGMVTAIPACVGVGWGLSRLAREGLPSVAGVPAVVFWCAALFVGVSVFGLLDIALFQPLPHRPRQPRDDGRLLHSMLAPLKDRPFVALSLFVGAMNFTVGFTNQFATLYVIERMKLDHVHAQLMLLAAPMVLQLLMLPAWGAAVDRVGRKPLLILSGLGLVPMSFGWCLMGSGGSVWLGYLLYAGGATLWTGVEVANFNAVIDATGRGAGGSGYHAANTMIVNLAGCVGGLVAGVVASQIGTAVWQPLVAIRPLDFYDALFALSGAVRILAVVVIAPMMIEPTARSLGYTIRFLFTYTLGRFLPQPAQGDFGETPAVPLATEPVRLVSQDEGEPVRTAA
jgi:MFS family permease